MREMKRTTSVPIFSDSDNLPGVVLHQPYAGLIRLAALGFNGKSIETRARQIRYRGPLVIIAGLEVQVFAFAKVPLLPPEQQRELGHVGVAVALFDVADCRPLRPEDEPRSWFYEPGRFAWMASRIRPLKPFKVRGMPGFVRVPRAQVLAAIEGPGFAFCPGCGKRDDGPDDMRPERSRVCAIDDSGAGCGHVWNVGGWPYRIAGERSGGTP